MKGNHGMGRSVVVSLEDISEVGILHQNSISPVVLKFEYEKIKQVAKMQTFGLINKECIDDFIIQMLFK